MYAIPQGRIIGIAEVVSHPIKGAKDGEERWPWRSKIRWKLAIADYERCPTLADINVPGGRDLKRSVQRQSHIGLKWPELQRAREALEAAFDPALRRPSRLTSPNGDTSLYHPDVSEPAVSSRQSSDPRADRLRERYFSSYSGEPVPVPVDSIAEDLLGLSIERSWDLSSRGVLLPEERTIVLNAHEAPRNEAPLRRYRFTIAHEIGHWICHCLGGVPQPIYCRTVHTNPDDGVGREREADRFAATLLMPEQAVRDAWAPVGEELAPVLERLVAAQQRHQAPARGAARARPSQAGPRHAPDRADARRLPVGDVLASRQPRARTPTTPCVEMTAVPEPGALVRLRDRHCVVTEVIPSTQPLDLYADSDTGGAGPRHGLVGRGRRLW